MIFQAKKFRTEEVETFVIEKIEKELFVCFLKDGEKFKLYELLDKEHAYDFLKKQQPTYVLNNDYLHFGNNGIANFFFIRMRT